MEVTTSGISRPDIEGGLYLHPLCPADSGGAGLSNLVWGYQVLFQQVTGTPQPPAVDATAWTATGPVVPLGDPATFSLACTTGEEDYHLGTVLAYDSTFGDRYVTVMGMRVQCGKKLFRIVSGRARWPIEGQPEGCMRGAIFDLDGTIADTAADLLAAANIAFAPHGLPALACRATGRMP